MMNRLPDTLTEPVLRACLDDGRPLRAFMETDSTNRVAKDWAREGAPSGALVTAEYQSAGRGRKGRSWLGEAGEAIAMSLILRPDTVEGVQSITLVAAVAAAEAIEQLAGCSVAIKWPNDLWLGERKLCGILTELVTGTDGGPYVVVGMGINVHQREFPGELAPIATSIRLGAGCRVHRGRLVAAIVHRMEQLLALWRERGFAAVARLYRPRMALLGQWVDLSLGEERRRLQLTGISDEGALTALDEKGEAVCVISGEVTVRRAE